MLEEVLFVVEKIALALIVGGGVIMAAGVRPILQKVLVESGNADTVATVEGISIGAWNRYNRYALLATLVLLVLDVIRVVGGVGFSYWHLGMVAAVLIALVKKLEIDRQLTNRLQDRAAAAVGSTEQKAGHRNVELLSKIILVVALLVMVLPL